MTTDPLESVNNLWLTDSRQPLDFGQAANAIFFAIRGEHHDGHAYVGDLYQKGVRQFVVERAALTPARRAEFATYTDAQFSEVDSSLQALQNRAAEHRAKFSRAAFSRAAFGGREYSI
ncbi:MAG TPA: Mur ligase domain-containing protein, partial [Hymenobacter sp.]|nr:Mur ligase domain-containing protein [Hymenobacter sp.]